MKQLYEKKTTIKICGTLKKDDDGEYFIEVEDRDSVTDYALSELLDSMNETLVTIQNEESL